MNPSLKFFYQRRELFMIFYVVPGRGVGYYKNKNYIVMLCK